MYPIRGLNDLFLGQKYRKISLKSTLFAYLFKSHLLVPCFIAMDCIGHPCGGLVKLVVINNDEWDHFEAFFHIVITLRCPILAHQSGVERAQCTC